MLCGTYRMFTHAVCADCLPVALFLSMTVRDRKTPTRDTAAAKTAATVPKDAERSRGRHAAITTNFNNWRSYKEWAQKIRGTWQDKE
jgi:hypothetical protein